MTGSAKQSRAPVAPLDCFVASFLAMTRMHIPGMRQALHARNRCSLTCQTAEQTDVRILAALTARGLQKIVPLHWRAQCYPKRGAGNAGRPLRPQSRVQCVGGTRGRHHGHTGTPGIPRAMVLTVSFALPGDRALLSPSSPRSFLLGNLTPASGRQDHTTSPSASAPLVYRAPSRPPHPHPTSVTIAKRPSSGWDNRLMMMICVIRKAENFCEPGWTRIW
jgi:hypothetical protein